MRLRAITGMLLMVLLVLGTGASIEGIRKAQDWSHAGDLAFHNRDYLTAYMFYMKAVDTFPSTRYGRYCASKADYCRRRIKYPTDNPANGDFFRELYDHFIW